MAAATANDLVSDTLATLREIYAKLDAIDTRDMDVGEQRQWFNQYSTIRQAIMTLEAADIEDLNAQAAKQAAQLSRAIDQCDASLHGVQEGEQIISAVSTILGSVTALVALFG